VPTSAPDATRPDATLQISNLTVRYRGLAALSDVSLRAEPGTVVSVLGANGAGKSTLLKAISGAVRTDEGTITLGGEELTGQQAHLVARRGVFHLPEGRGLFRDLTIRENLLLAARGRPDSALDEVFERFPLLRDRSHARASALSGGQQQLLAVARIMLARPRLILIDELSFGLAPLAVKDAFELLAELNRDLGSTALIVEQNVVRALEVSSYTYVLKNGSVVLEGRPDELLSSRELLFSYLGAESQAQIPDAPGDARTATERRNA
jgi:branched-chain amino acid transport system ATP-binding protein